MAPTIEDARRAAEALAAVGVGRVVLFGSVARGEATEHSDVDLVAIYDDIDYSKRGAIAVPTEAAARAAAGCAVDVLVTDRPEWKMRTTRVRTSLEARAARFGTILIDRPPGAVDWDKEMVMPTDDYQEALYRLGILLAPSRACTSGLNPVGCRHCTPSSAWQRKHTLLS